MNNLTTGSPVTSYEDIQRERERLQALIEFQKHMVRQDLEELKSEIKKEVRPVVDAVNLGKKFISGETRNQTIFRVGASLLIDIMLRRLFAKSGFLVRAVVPVMLKNYSTHLVAGLEKKLLSPSSNGRPHGKLGE